VIGAYTDDLIEQTSMTKRPDKDIVVRQNQRKTHEKSFALM